MPEKIPVYVGNTRDAISRQAAKLLVKRGRAIWVDVAARDRGIVALPKDIEIRSLPDGSVLLANGLQSAADPARFRQRFIHPSDQLLYALRLPNNHPRKDELLSEARQRFKSLTE